MLFRSTAMTHPDYRGRGICTELASQVYLQCERKGFGLVFGFPNNNIYDLYMNKLEWFGFGRLQSWENKDRLRALDMPSSGYSCEEIYSFDEESDNLWYELREDSTVVVPRVRSYLNWRYFEKPESGYVIYALRDDSYRTNGYMVLKVFTENGKRLGHIVDFFCIKSEGACHALLG